MMYLTYILIIVLDCIRLYLVVPVNKFSFLLKDLQKEGRKIDVREKCNDVNTNKYLIIIIHK